MDWAREDSRHKSIRVQQSHSRVRPGNYLEGILQEFLQQYMCPISVETTCLAEVLTRAAVLRRPSAVPPIAYRQPDTHLLLGPGTTTEMTYLAEVLARAAVLRRPSAVPWIA